MIDSDWTSTHSPWIVGHRGAPRRARENTLESFDFAEAEGADAIELDLQQTRDGELIVFHDDVVSIGSDRHPVRSMASIDVRELRLESPFGEYRIPTLDDVLQRYGRSLRYVLEMKVSPSTDRRTAARRVAGLVTGFHLAPRCLVASFDAEILRRIDEEGAGIALSLLFDGPTALPDAGTPRGVFPPCVAVGPRADLVDDGLMAAASLAGLSVHPWTVDSPEEIQALADRGVASITTNDPDLARRVLRGE
jgi:glycerophosphoryl diester phosphodiesterase